MSKLSVQFVFWLAVLFFSVTANAAPKLYFFTSDYCGPCQEMHPIVDNLKRDGAQVIEINTDTSRGQAEAQRWGVRSLPSFKVVDGKLLWSHVGKVDEGTLRSHLQMDTPSVPSAPADGPSWNFTPRMPHHRAAVRVDGGSGVYVELDGGLYGILTAAHVDDDRVIWYDGTTTELSSLERTGDKYNNDVSIFLLPGPKEGITPLRIAKSDPQIGDTVEVMGYGGPTRTLRHYTGRVIESQYQNEMCLDCCVAAGDSGGAVLNDKKEVVSVVSAGDGRTWENKEARAHSMMLVPRCTPVRDFIARVVLKFGGDASPYRGLRKLPDGPYDDWYPQPDNSEPGTFPPKPDDVLPPEPDVYEPPTVDVPDVIFGSEEWRKLQEEISQQDIANKRHQEELERKLLDAQKQSQQQIDKSVEESNKTLLDKLRGLEDVVKGRIVDKVPDTVGESVGWAKWIGPMLGVNSALATAGLSAAIWLGVRGAKRIRDNRKANEQPVFTPIAEPATVRRENPAPEARTVNRPRVVSTESPPPPQHVVNTNHFVQYETDSHREAYDWASREYVKKLGQNGTTHIQVLNSLIQQYLNAKES